VKSLIVTADDLGLHPGTTDGALRAHRQGIVTACSVVANGSAFRDAAERLRDTPSIAVGVHLTLVEEKPLAGDAHSLVGGDGRFFRSYAAFLPRYLAHAIGMNDVERELRAQIETMLGAGLRVTHANGHQHLHLLPRIFEIVQRLAAEYRIGYVRVVDDHGGTASLSRRVAVEGLNALGRRARRRSALRTNDRTVGVAEAGHLKAESLVRLVALVDGLTELVVHPGIDDRALAAAYGWRYEWDAETDALCDPRVRAAVKQHAISLVSPVDA
jgi:chitin disaccharide deacetylase